MLLRICQTIAVLFLALAFFLFEAWALGWIPTYTEYCEKSQHTGYEECATYHITLAALWHVGKILDSISPALTAIATALIGGFTYTIWQANREHIKHLHATERAYIVGGGPTRRVDRDGQLIDDPDIGWVSIGNYGKTPAILKKVEWGFCDEAIFPKEKPVSEILKKRLLPKEIIDAIKSREPEDVLRPGDPPRALANTTFSIKENNGRIFFGRFTYATLFDHDEHFSTFKLRMGPGAESTGLPGSYTDWD